MCVCVRTYVRTCVCVCVHTHTQTHTHTHTQAGEQGYIPDEDVEVEVVRGEEVGALVQEDLQRQQKVREDKILALMQGLFFFFGSKTCNISRKLVKIRSWPACKVLYSKP